MSAFFDWDCALVKKAILDQLVKDGRSINSYDYDQGADEWGDMTKISLPEFKDFDYFTEEWDVNIWDNDGKFTITAYPVYQGNTETSTWITCYEGEMK